MVDFTIQIPVGNGSLCCDVVVLGASKARDDNLPTAYPDEYLEHWSEVWRRNRALMPGVTLLAFLVDPHAILRHYLDPASRPERDGHEPLLPRQQAVADRLDEEALQSTVEQLEDDLTPPDAQLRGRRLIEPLHHHAHDHHHRSGFYPKREGGNG